MKNKTVINSEQSLNSYIEYLRIQFEQHKYLTMSLSTGKQRTQTQNSSLHLFCDHLATALNDGGFDFRLFIKPGFPIPFDEYLVKKFLWKPIQKAITGQESSTKPKTHEYALIYDALNVKLAEHGLFVAWPSRGDK